MKNLIEKIKNFKSKKILVIGDLILDEYIEGYSERLSPEAPVPVINFQKQVYCLGGAGNTSLNIKKLNSEPILIGVLGNDKESKIFKNLLENNEIKYNYILTSKNNRTINKERIISNNQQICRIDKNDKIILSKKEEKYLINSFYDNLDSDVIVISDYGKGTVTKYLLKVIIEEGNKTKKTIIIDPKPKNTLYYKNASFITPNYKEAQEMLKLNFQFNLQNAEILAEKLYRFLNSNVLLTLSENGIYYYSKKLKKHFPTHKREVRDVSGAGDVVVASLAVGIANKLKIKDSIFLANHAAGVKVQKYGVQPVSLEEVIYDIKLYNNIK
ncbi:MAG: PfkB family carbohydrate kinase [Candidatus Pacearchaeota archaeon]